MLGSRRAGLLIERNLYVYKHGWMIILSGFFRTTVLPGQHRFSGSGR